MKETDLKKTDSAVSYVRYIFDPDKNDIERCIITVRDETMFPKVGFGKVIHYSGRKYAVYFEGYHEVTKKYSAYKLFKQFYLNKLADAAEEVSKFATILAFFE